LFSELRPPTGRVARSLPAFMRDFFVPHTARKLPFSPGHPSGGPTMAKKKSSKKKNSLVGNINKRKKAGKSRSKKKSTISAEAYDEMEQGWPKSKRKKTAKKKAAQKNK
jgi:hypothetical protein